MKILITQTVNNDIHNQYIGKYLDDETKTASCSYMYGGTESLQLFKDDDISIDVEALNLKTPLLIGITYNIEGLLRIKAQNTKQGVLINATKIEIIK